MTANILIIGPQGSGKGTQANLIAQKLSIPAISAGDLLRYNVKNKTELGLKIEEYMKRGDLLPDNFVTSLIAERLDQSDVEKGFVLDGYPRKHSQLISLDEIMAELGKFIDAVIVLDVDKDELYERMSKRAKIEERSDDTPQAIRHRLDQYYEQTQPLIDEYKARGIAVEVNGVGNINDINERIFAGLEHKIS
jgi:adenylate kinase